MSSQSGAADATLPTPGASSAERARIAALAAAGDEDTGQPVNDLPPLVEPIADPFSRRPPRRNFLAPANPAPASRARSGPVTAPSPASPAPAARGAAPAPVAKSAAVPPAPAAKPAPALASTPLAPSLPATAPPLVEPVAPVPAPTSASAAKSTPAAGATPTVAPARTVRIKVPPSRWLAPARRLWPAGWRKQALTVGGIVAVIAVLLIGVDILRIGPFAPVRHYSTAAAPQDLPGRVAYFQRGAEAGDASAELQLAILYARGEGVGQSYETAAKWFRAAADQGVARAQYDLGVMYERARGVPLDLTQAADWYLKAAQAGFPLAQYNLAVCYTKGQGIRRDLNEAALWYHRAAAQGVVQAMINLAVMYDKGDGVAVSPVDAYAWYRAAGRRGDQSSASRGEELYNTMAKLDQVRAAALAGDVAGSIHDPAPGGEAAAGSSSTAEH